MGVPLGMPLGILSSLPSPPRLRPRSPDFNVVWCWWCVDAVDFSKASWAAGRGSRRTDFASNLALFVSNAARPVVFHT